MRGRLGNVYLWIAIFLTIPVGRLRDLAGTEPLIVVCAVFVALTSAAIWKMGAARAGSDHEDPAFAPGVLLVDGPLTLSLVASITREPTAS